jgi:predicted transcriptional regulator
MKRGRKRIEDSSELKQRLRQTIRQAKILSMSNLYSSGKTLQEIGDLYGITREAVRLYLKNVVSASEGGRALKTRIQENIRIADSQDKKLIKELQYHGKRSSYNNRCRCELCRKTHRDYHRERKKHLKWNTSRNCYVKQ